MLQIDINTKINSLGFYIFLRQVARLDESLLV